MLTGLYTARRTRRLTQRALAAQLSEAHPELGVTRWTISRWERGVVHDIPGRTLMQLATILDWNPSALLEPANQDPQSAWHRRPPRPSHSRTPRGDYPEAVAV